MPAPTPTRDPGGSAVRASHVGQPRWAGFNCVEALGRIIIRGPYPEPKKRAWTHGRAWKMKIRAWKNQDPCFNFYKLIYALLHKYPV